MKFITKYCLLFLSIVLLSCKKELDEIPESNSPIFSISGHIDETSIDEVVDENRANFVSNFDNVNGVRFFKGTMINTDYELEIGFFDGNLDKSSLSLNDLKNLPQLFFMNQTSSDLFYANKYYFNNPQYISTIEWFVDNIYYSSNTISIKNPGRYTICAKVTYTDQTQTTICNDLILGYKKNAVFSLEYDLDPNNNLLAWIYEDNSPISSVVWYIDGVFECDCLYLNKQLDDQIHEIKAEISFQNGTKRNRTILVDGNENKHSLIDFAFLENLSDITNDYKSKVTYRENGIEFRSDVITNSQNKFQLNDIFYVGKDENQNDVYCLKGNIQALLKSLSTNETKSINLDVSWGVILK
jgi:hypothetical protein